MAEGWDKVIEIGTDPVRDLDKNLNRKDELER